MNIASFGVDSSTTRKAVAELTVSCTGHDSLPTLLCVGQRIVVGSDTGAEICLHDESVAAAHCVISAESGGIVVKDCFSRVGTLVEGVKVHEVKLSKDTEIQVGSAVISVRFPSMGPFPNSQDVFQARNVNGSAMPPSSNEIDEQESEVQSHVVQVLQAKLDDSLAEIEVLHERLFTAGESRVASPVEFKADPYKDEMIELLKAEVLDLQAALAERDLTSVHNVAAVASNDDNDFLARDEADKLVCRLETLLEELEQRDEQIELLTDLLATTEETNRTAEDEKRHLNSWLEDIEKRFGDREKEWQAQRDNMQHRLEESFAERDLAVLAVTTDTSNARLEAAQKIMAELRATVESQRLQLAESQRKIAELSQRTSTVQPAAVREELMQLAEERADVARQRRELEVLRTKERQPGVDASTLKLQALRQHLNEIHQQEQTQKEERKLSHRIAKLWSRLEGR